jgi:uncharacterized protein (DUF1499 family)
MVIVPLPETAMAALFGNIFAGTPPTTLGVRDGRLAPCPDKPNCVSSQATDDGHAVKPIAYAGDVAAAMARLAKIIATQDGATIVAQRGDYLHVEYQSKLIGFVDDVELQADPAAHVIHVRSASRLGHSDFGVNRARVEALRAAFAAGPS